MCRLKAKTTEEIDASWALFNVLTINAVNQIL